MVVDPDDDLSFWTALPYAVSGGYQVIIGKIKADPHRYWEDLGGELTSAPAVASRGKRRLDVFLRATDNSLYHRFWNTDHWSGWDLSGEN